MPQTATATSMLKLKTLKDIPTQPTTILIRVDYNVLIQDGLVADDRRLRESLPTIKELLKAKHRVVIISHLGRPEGVDQKLSLKPIAEYLRTKLDLPVQFVADTVGSQAHEAIEALEPGEALLLENLRFHPGEEQNNPHFAQQLCHSATVFVNDAFSAAHRVHASTVGVTRYLQSVAGLALQKEVEMLGGLMEKPKRPFVMVLGGAKISDKVGAVKHLAKIADCVLIGGAIANNFLKADGLEIHKSFIEEHSADIKKRSIDYVKVAKRLLNAHKTERMLIDDYIPLPKIIYPIDVLAARTPDAKPQDVEHIELTHDAEDTLNDKDIKYFDIGPQTVQLYKAVLDEAKTIFWNGPMGMWEQAEFAQGTKSIAKAISQSDAHTVIGGGDSLAAAEHFGLEQKYTYSSAAGGAALEFLGGKVLPGIRPLLKK